MAGRTMYKVRFATKGKKPTYLRLNTEDEARRLAAGSPSAKYVGPVTVTAIADGWREVK